MSDAELPDTRTESQERSQESLDAQTVALRIVAVLLIFGAMAALKVILVPLSVAVVLAIAISPVASRIERLGLGRFLTSLGCAALVASVLLMVFCMIAYQAGMMLREADEYIERVSKFLADTSRATGGDAMLTSLGFIREFEPSRSAHQGTDSQTRSESEVAPPSRTPETPDELNGLQPLFEQERIASGPAEFWHNVVTESLLLLGQWVISGLGGIVGAIGGIIIMLALMFFCLFTRRHWIDRIRLACYYLGMRPRAGLLEQIKNELVTYVGCLALVMTGYVVLLSPILWLLDMPQPLFWGLLTALLVVVPWFGPILAGTMIVIVSLVTSGTLWQPIAVMLVFVTMQTIEGYGITPMLYGRAVKFDPLAILVGVLFFGWLWGPLGLALAVPMMIFIRGLVLITPGTPALDSLVETNQDQDGGLRMHVKSAQEPGG